MKVKFFNNVPAWQKLILFIFLFTLSLLFTTFLALIIAAPIFHISFEEINRLLMLPPSLENIQLLKYFQIFQSIGVFIIPSVIAIYIFSPNSPNYDFFKKLPLQSIFLIVLAIVFMIPLINVVAKLNSDIRLPQNLHDLEMQLRELEDSAQQLLNYFFLDKSLKGFVINFFMIAICAPIGEELFFRGILQNIMIEWTKNIHWGVIITGFIFSFFHFQFFGFIPRFLLGIYFGYLFIISKSIWLPILAHLVNNGIAVIAYHLTEPGAKEVYIDKVGTYKGDLVIVIVSTLIFIFTNYLILKLFKKQSSSNEDFESNIFS